MFHEISSVSQASIASSNPFDDGDREDADTLTIASYMTQSGIKHHRKKRRAPPPPNVSNLSYLLKMMSDGFKKWIFYDKFHAALE